MPFLPLFSERPETFTAGAAGLRICIFLMAAEHAVGQIKAPTNKTP